MIAFITLILTIGLYMLLGFAALIIVFVIALLCALGYHAQKNKVKQTQPSKRVCPMCGSPKVRFKHVVNGTTSTGGVATVSSNRLASGDTKIHRRNIAYCENCGYSFDFTTQDDLNAQYNKLNTNEGCAILVAVILGVILITIWFYSH
jgi:rubredoxin